MVSAALLDQIVKPFTSSGKVGFIPLSSCLCNFALLLYVTSMRCPTLLCCNSDSLMRCNVYRPWANLSAYVHVTKMRSDGSMHTVIMCW